MVDFWTHLELFGYENFANEITWKRTAARSDAQGFNQVHDTLLVYSASRDQYWHPVFGPLSQDYVRSHYKNVDASGSRYRLDNLTSPNPRPNMMYSWKGYEPPPFGWRFSLNRMQEMDAQGLIHYPERGKRLSFKRYLSEDGMPIQSVWADVAPVNSQAADRLGYPTQKPVALIERIISASCPPGGLVLDCFMGSGTTCEAAERLGRRFIGIDNSKYAVHLARKRLIQLHGQARPPEKQKYDYVDCKSCKSIQRKTKRQKSPGPYQVRPFTVENMGVYQRAEQWQDFQTQRSRYRDEMIRVFGGEPVDHSPLLHGIKGASWVHVGPLDGPVSSAQVWQIARAARDTSRTSVTILSADFNTLSGSDKDEIKQALGIHAVVRVIPQSAIDEVRRRIELIRKAGDGAAIESMAIPAFYAPLSIVLRAEVDGRVARLTLSRCEIDIESFIASQRPALKPLTKKMSAPAKKRAQAEREKWEARHGALAKWLEKAETWQRFIDFWAIDWDYGRRVGADGKPIFETDWQSFRVRRSKAVVEDLVFTAELRYVEPGDYRIAARVTDVFGNDGIATVNVEVR